MTRSEFELLEIKVEDFQRELSWFAQQNLNRDRYVAELLLDLRAHINDALNLIEETQQG